jgi:hypothetical protein
VRCEGAVLGIVHRLTHFVSEPVKARDVPTDPHEVQHPPHAFLFAVEDETPPALK